MNDTRPSNLDATVPVPNRRESVGPINELLDRHVPQYTAIYLGAAWGLVQFVDFIGTRYLLSPHWTDLTLLALALLLPSVVLLTYNHGRRGPDQWRRSEKIFIPINCIVLVVAVGLMGATTNLGAVTTHVVVKDEKGNRIEKVIPAASYRNRVAFFNFDAAGTTQKPLQVGLPFLAYIDLQQQGFVEAVPGALLREELRKKGYADGINVPLTLKREIANDMHMPMFMTGNLQRVDRGVLVNVELYETKSGRLLNQHEIEASDVLAAGDAISAQLLKDLDTPALPGSRDMPLTEQLTRDPLALRLFLEAVAAVHLHDDWQSARRSVEKAIKLDSTFAAAQYLRYQTALFSNQPQIMQQAIQAALDHSYRLPERMQYAIKAEFYFAKQDFNNAYAVLDMMSQLYPDDIQIELQLVTINGIRDDKDALIRSIRKVLRLDPGRTELLQMLAQIYEAKGNTTEALKLFEEYAQKFPREARSYREIGRLNRAMGNAVAARAALNKALVVTPQDVPTLVELGMLERDQGEFEAAEKRFAEALGVAKTPSEKTGVLHAMAGLQQFRGQIAASVTTLEAMIAEAAKFQPPAVLLMMALPIPGVIAKSDTALAKQHLAATARQLVAPWNMYLPIAELAVYDAIGDPDREERAVDALETLIKTSSFNFMRDMAARGRGRVSELRGDCNAALRSFREWQTLDPLDVDPIVSMGRCYRKLGRTAEATNVLMAALRARPADGEANLEMALLFKATGDAARAKQYLQQARRTWQNADPGYRTAQQAREYVI